MSQIFLCASYSLLRTLQAIEKKFEIIVNTRTKEWNGSKINYQEVVDLAYPPPHSPGEIFTVSYSKGPPQNPSGELVKGQTVFVDNGMVFIVDRTTQS